MKFVFFRHGETDSNVRQIIQGATVDTPLNAKGLQQARLLSENISKYDLEKIYSSKLVRAIQTATLSAASCNLSVHPISGLEELHYGEAEGMLIEDAIIKYADIANDVFDLGNVNRKDVRLPDGESFNDCIARVVPVLQKIKEENDGNLNCVGIFTHGAVMRILYEHYFNEIRQFANCECFEVDL